MSVWYTCYLSMPHFIFFMALLAVHQSQGVEVSEILKKCCGLGIESAEERADCRSGVRLPEIPPEQISICLSATQLCCANRLREKRCEEGKTAAKTGGNCPDEDSADKQHCCESCKLGLISGSLNGACRPVGVTFGALWDSAYQSCCRTANQPPLNPQIDHPGSDIERDVCQLLAGELCAQVCVSTTPGSYICQCRPGFVLMSDGKSCRREEPIVGRKMRCADVNPCSHVCTDTKDGIACTCNPGFLLSSDNVTCHKLDEAVEQRTTCPVGYRYHQLTRVCHDIDECEENKALCGGLNEKCVNLVGSFNCSKRELIKPPERTVIGSCRPGYKLDATTATCIDINECTEIDENPCDSNQKCENTNGSFICLCRIGFQLDSITHACVDINECQVSLHNCLPSQRCDNTIGSFQCIRYTNCGTGYTLNGETGHCEDDDECILGTHNCNYLGNEWQCRNTQGSFRCERKSHDNRPAMVEPKNPATTKRPTPICRPGGYCHQVRCPPGYEPLGNSCIDINECDQGGTCRPNQRCINKKGSYTCTDILNCQSGFKLNYEKTQCIDIDECSEQHGLCSHNCINLLGSFLCTCRTGYILNNDNRTCADINECEMYPDIRHCMGYCVNQLGSYSCQCPQGYRLGINGASCEDIDECSHENKVCTGKEEVCLNMRGSYRCTSIICPPGYIKDNRLKNRCTREVNSCQESDTACQKNPLSYTFHYITLVSNLTIPNSGKIDLFSMRGPLWSSTTVNFSLELIRARAPPDIKTASRHHFALTKTAFNQAGIALVRPLPGPQDIQLKLTMEFYNHGLYGGKTISNIDIYVSQYPF